jgi:hypothetical protein
MESGVGLLGAGGALDPFYQAVALAVRCVSLRMQGRGSPPPALIEKAASRPSHRLCGRPPLPPPGGRAHFMIRTLKAGLFHFP